MSKSTLLKSAIVPIIALFILSTNQLNSQPTNYCAVCPNNEYQATYTYQYCVDRCWYTCWGVCCPLAYLTEVTLIDRNTNTNVFSRTSGADGQQYFNPAVSYEVIMGQPYTLHAKVLMGYYVQWNYNFWVYTSCRAYIDWNQDGDWFDAGENITNLAAWFVYHQSMSPSQYNFNFTVPETAVAGKTRMRVIGSYWMYNYGPCFAGYAWISLPNYFYNYGYYGEAEDYILEITAGVKDTYPGKDDVLFANESYNGVRRTKDGVWYDFKKPQMIFTGNQKAGSKATFIIQGPLPSNEIVYEGLDAATGSTQIDVGNQGATITLGAARGTFADGSQGAFKASRGGTYRVVAYLIGSPKEKINTFFVSWDDDLACVGIVSPKNNEEPAYFKYLVGQTFKVTGLFQNVGLRQITSFRAYARFYKPNGDFLFEDVITYNSPPLQPLRPGDKAELDLPTKRFNDVGIYSMEMNCELLSADDQDSYNDSIPRSDWGKYTIEVSYEIQLQASNIFRPAPGQTILGNRPLIPMAEFRNVGIGDASFVPARMRIYKLPDTQNSIWSSNVTIEDLQAGKYNTKTVFFDQLILKESGDYMAEIIVTAVEDVVRQDDTLRTYFSVIGGLSGTYTVGTQNIGNTRNFPNIDSVLNALYYRGLAGPVTFELTDAVYDAQSKFATQPAIDLTSRIIGAGWDPDTRQINTITFKPSRDRARNRGSITINMYSGSGIGVRFGQNVIPSNQYAIFHQFGNPDNANSSGYISFDGGSQKSFKFILHSRSQVFGSAFYFGQGSTNISVQNCLIENASPERASNVWLPAVVYSPPTYTFQPDSMGSGVDKRSYYAGITNRSLLLKFEDVMFMRLDTISNSNNVIRNNEISKFGYGIVSLGLGTLYKQGEGRFVDYYNTNNLYEGNLIKDITRGGMFIGYESNSKIRGNRILNVGGGTLDAAGIIAGGNSREGVQGYNNMRLEIDGNEISDIKSATMSHGIKVEQVQRTYQRPAGGLVYSPMMDEKMIVKNNVIWGLQAMSTGAHLAGIHLFSERNYSMPTFIEQFITPQQIIYRMRGDLIANNTVYLTDDGGAYVNTGAIVGLGVQNAVGAHILNNAVTLKDQSISASSPIATAMFYQGELPKDGGFHSDRNAFWLGSSGGSVYRYIETDANNNILEIGERNEFETLDQWRVWTGADKNSTYGDFTRDLSWFGTDIKRLRIVMQPQAPVGSILNNRGEKLQEVSHDIDGNQRGITGQRYDVGAFEFDGRMYVTDLEMLSITEPSAYKNGTGIFSDAEYIMTEAPVEVKATLRNSGSLQQSDITVKVEIFRETPAGTFPATAELTQTIKTSLPSTESGDVKFNLDDAIGEDFHPQPYTSLSGYTVPTHLSSMAANVTPRYRIQISVDSDEENTNNVASKVVRFYLKRTPIKLLISTEYSYANIGFMPDPTDNEIAGRLNADSLIGGMRRLGWATEPYRNRYDIDIFDRQGWPVRSVDYKMYRTIIWTDAFQTTLNRYQVMNLIDFLQSYDGTEKKNLIIGSEELVRTHDNSLVPANYRPELVNLFLRAQNFTPSNPLGDEVSNDGNSVKGRKIGRNLVEMISSTQFSNDRPPYCGLMRVHPEGAGVADIAYEYVNHGASPNNSTMGVATTTLTRNVVHLGVDWRHWKDMERLLRAILDYIESNGGTVIPVELVNFDAQARGKQVDIIWSTASERESSRFELEKAEVRASGLTQYLKIAEVKAAGTSQQLLEYGPIIDRDVEYGRSYSYRLRMVDLDGQTRLSDEKVVTLELPLTGLQVSAGKPNPAKERVTFDVLGGFELEVIVVDVNGKSVTLPITIESGRIELNVSQLSSGVYTLIVKSGDDILTRQMTVVR